jgi:hypothetical protein
MKRLFGFFCLFFIIQSSFSQDIIIKTNGDTIRCKVVEVGIDLIKCRDYRYQDGQIYNILKRDVEKVVYENNETEMIEGGEPLGKLYRDQPVTYRMRFFTTPVVYQGITRLTEKNIQYIIRPYREVSRNYRAGKRLIIFGDIIFIPSLAILSVSLANLPDADKANNTAIAVGSIGTFAGLLMVWFGNQNIDYALKLFNETVGESSKVTMKAGLSGNGLGMTIIF